VVPGGQAAEVRVVGMTEERKYYSVRTGKNQGDIKFDLPLFKRAFLNTYKSFRDRYYFQQAYGYDCTDEGFVSGLMGEDIEIFFLSKLRKPNLWPVETKIDGYIEDDFFDVIELLYDYVSKPLKGHYHSWNNCGWHYSTFDKITGQSEFRSELNPFLNGYLEGYELSQNGQILLQGGPGLQDLLATEIPVHDPKNVDEKVKYAVLKFRRHRATVEDKREAVRSLADVLEFLRPAIKKLPLTKDEGDLFNIANNFGIRHHNAEQKTEYDQDTYLEWIFYSYLSTIHLVIRIIQSHKGR
jgi:hypothetical protein